MHAYKKPLYRSMYLCKVMHSNKRHEIDIKKKYVIWDCVTNHDKRKHIL